MRRSKLGLKVWVNLLFCFLESSEYVDLRKPLIELAKGSGVEIGPGNAPQIFPSSDVSVRYIERTPIKEWNDLYGSCDRKTSGAVRELGNFYYESDGQQLDLIDEGELDFIFSSHVIEHFCNPLGTFEIWKRKLKGGGRVIGIVPDANNCFDLLQPLSEPSDWINEWVNQSWKLTQDKYEKWVRYTQPYADLEKLCNSPFSIHAHFYTPRSFAVLLQMTVDRLGFRGFHIRSTSNAKDFAFVLENA